MSTIKLNIQQSESLTELINSSILDKIYDLAKGEGSDELSNDSVLLGRVATTTTYLDVVDYLTNRFPNLHISVDNYCIRFADPEVIRVLTAKGVIEEGGGLTTEQAAQVNAPLYLFYQNTSIVKFDELPYFTKWNNSGLGRWFELCSNLESVDITNVTTLGMRAFYSCSKLEYYQGYGKNRGELYLPNISYWSSDYHFNGNIKLNKVTNLGSVSNIPNNCFKGCSNLEGVVLPSQCITLGQECFRNCTTLCTINLQNVQTIGTNVFNGCSSLEYCDGPNSTQGELNLPNLTGTLRYNAFEGCAKLTSIASLGSITSIENSAFENCTNLATINFPNTITSVGKNAFNNTAWYNGQSNGLICIGNILYKCKNPSGAIVIPNNIVSITEDAFLNCSSLTSVTIGSGVTSIGVGSGVF